MSSSQMRNPSKTMDLIVKIDNSPQQNNRNQVGKNFA